MHTLSVPCMRLVRQGGVSNDTFICFTSRYPVIFFQKNRLPRTSHNVVVKFDSADQWILTAGLPLESVFMVRGHVGNCFDVETLNTLEWEFMNVTPEEPQDTIAHMIPGSCVMPSSERWHCTMTTKEREISPGLHLFDWEPYQRSWGDEQVSTRQSDTVPPETALAQAENLVRPLHHECGSSIM